MGFIDIKNLIFEYFRRDDEGNVEEMVEALSDVSLEVEKGDFIVIAGENGSGKSTLAKQINALLTPSEGAVIIDGMDTSNEELRFSIRKKAGMIFQNPDNQIIGSVVEEDVAFGPENLGFSTKKIWNSVDDSLKAVDMNELRTSSTFKLSGGQKQRVAIAGVLAMEPECIIFDEATSMLEPKSRCQMMQIAKQLNSEKNITIIWITHHMAEVMAADKVFVMKQGNIVLQGTPMQIFSETKMLADCGLQLPILYQYIQFLNENGVINDHEAASITKRKELIELLCNKYYGKNVIDNEKFYEQKNTQKENVNPAEGILLNNVTYIYNRGYAHENIALDNVSLHIGKGEFVAVIGHTGSGKSTLMQHLNGLLMPDSGNVYYDGKDISDKDYPIKELRQKVGLVFQYPEYQLFAETVEQDVCFGPMNMDIPLVNAQKRAYDAIAAVGLPDTIYDASPFTMSGGQKRRVAIAGVLAMEPEMLVLDEPTAGLDPVAAKKLLDMLKKLNEEHGITIVIVSHDMEEVAEYAKRVIVMDGGRKRIDGETWEVFQNAEALESMNLAIPFGIELLTALSKSGIKGIDLKKHDQRGIFEELLRLA